MSTAWAVGTVEVGGEPLVVIEVGVHLYEVRVLGANAAKQKP